MTDKANKETPVEGAENSIYSNSVQLDITFYDFKFRFGRIFPEGHKTDINIYMSPEHTKMLYLVLQEQIQKYEKRFSEIIIPSEIKPTSSEGKSK